MAACSTQQAAHLANLKTLYTKYATAIEKLGEKGGVKEYTIGDRTFRYNDIKDLYDLLNDLNAKICKLEKGRSARYQGIIPINN